jgi:hypothetical protein
VNTDDLRAAYAQFVEAARRGPFADPHDGGWRAEMVLAHLVVGDRLIAEAAARAIAGGTAQFDNAASLSEPYLEAIIQAAAGWDNLVDAVRHGGDELIALAQRMTDDQASTPIPARIVSDGQAVLDATVPVGHLVRGPADIHLRLHTEQLTALAHRAPSLSTSR